MPDTDLKILQSDCRILREALSHCANYGHPSQRMVAINALKKFSVRIASYCKCPEKSQISGLKICLDCGKRETE